MYPVLNVSSQFESQLNVTDGLNNPSRIPALHPTPSYERLLMTFFYRQTIQCHLAAYPAN